MTQKAHDIKIDVETHFLDGHSDPSEYRYVFSYTITITNVGQKAAQLISRYWLITDADNHTEEVRGPGVVGEQPMLSPGNSFRYTSGTVFRTPVGTMQGSYELRDEDGVTFKASIPVIGFSRPGVLH